MEQSSPEYGGSRGARSRGPLILGDHPYPQNIFL